MNFALKLDIACLDKVEPLDSLRNTLQEEAVVPMKTVTVRRVEKTVATDTVSGLSADTTTRVPFANAGAIPEEFKVDTIRLHYEELYTSSDTANTASVTTTVGKEVEPIPYQLYSDNILTGCIFFCFFLLSYVLFNGKHYLAQQVKDLFYVRERTNLFAVETGSDIRYRLLLILQTCLFLGIFFFDYSYDFFPELFSFYPSVLLLGVYVGIVVLYFILKVLLYTWVNWIFFDKQKSSLWLESYFLIYSLFGILLFPLLLLVVYFDLSNFNSFISFVILAILGEIMLFYKCFNIFFNKMYGILYFIVYFCALEMVPCFLLWQALISTNNLLIIKN